MTGNSPDATVAAIREQAGKGITAMLPTQDAAVVSAELAGRFGLPLWQFTVSATDANRHVIRYSRLITGRSKIAVIPLPACSRIAATVASGEWPVIDPVSPKQKSM